MRVLEGDASKEGMCPDLSEVMCAQSCIRHLHDHPDEQISRQRADSLREFQIEVLDSHEYQIFRKSVKRWSSNEYLEEQATKRPSVGTEVCTLVLYDLRCHELRSAHVVLENLVSGLVACTLDLRIFQVLRSAEIDELDHTLLHHHILCFQVTVHNPRLSQVCHCAEELREPVPCHTVTTADGLHQFPQLATRAFFQDHVDGDAVSEVVVKFRYVRVVQSLQDVFFHPNIGRFVQTLTAVPVNHLHRDAGACGQLDCMVH
mmetsp:Transcript_16882/g.45741  ORF Transcript_16882/g.45741 Transcript_16882/m.45741 type:complete len:260 (-) Transcript_16882:147-926(-)